MATRIGRHRGLRVIAVDLVDERLARAAERGAEVIDLRRVDDVAEEVRSRTVGRGADSVVDAVGMEAHGSPVAALAQRATALMPRGLAAALMQRAGVDRLAALYTAIDAVRRGGTISLSGVYGGQSDPMPMLTLFDKQITLRMGQANVRRWSADILPLLEDGDPLGTEAFATHHLSLEDAPKAYADFQAKNDGTVKVVFRP
jgi:threonine dehydrogenase-like Zn-dependent dehydrogenase